MTYYMHINTGSVGTLEDWLDDQGQEEIGRCIAEGHLVEVVADGEGGWVAAILASETTDREDQR